MSAFPHAWDVFGALTMGRKLRLTGLCGVFGLLTVAGTSQTQPAPAQTKPAVTRSEFSRPLPLTKFYDTPDPLPGMSVAERRIVGMRTLEICERCDGTGADPFQYEEEITVCVECNGDGCHVTYLVELEQTA